MGETKKSGVTLNVKGLEGVDPIGVSITYSVGNLPICLLSVAPHSTDPKIENEASGILSDVDKNKRINDVVVSASVTAVTGTETITNNISFTGILDGLSLSKSYGGNTYQAVIKPKTQVLLEVTTLTPGLYVHSQNVFKVPDFAMVNKSGEDAISYWSFATAINNDLLSKDPITFYRDVLIALLEIQKDKVSSFIGTAVSVEGLTQVFTKLFNDNRYKRALISAIAALKTLNVSHVVQGLVKRIKVSQPAVSHLLRGYLLTGSNIVFENLSTFIGSMGCGIVWTDKSGYVVPANSFIKQVHMTPDDYGEISQYPNIAFPANYNSYVYNDNGYRDIAHVVLLKSFLPPGTNMSQVEIPLAFGGEFHAPDSVTRASGVLVTEAHPFLTEAYNTAKGSDLAQAKKGLDSPGISLYETPEKYEAVVSNEEISKVLKNKEKPTKEMKDVCNMLAEIKYYQHRYSDRLGSVTMDFNPNWVPGTGGTLYIRETAMFLDFYVTSVTHTIELSAPNNGSAVTTVNFNCGRMGKSPIGLSKEPFFGYTLEDEQKVREAFIKDIGAS